ncbi:MAG: hypothetical protein R3C26_06990 [Calditrichia bacterium]
MAISWKVQTDSFTVSGTDTTWFAEEDETYSYQITVRNTGTLTATNVQLRDILPDSVLNAGDTLSFAIGDLLPLASETVAVLDPTVVSDLPFAPFPLVNDHRDRRQRRSALADIYRHGFRHRKTVCPNHHNIGNFVESAN